MILSGLTAVTLGCGLSGLVAARHLRFLGAKTVTVLLEACPDCDGEECDLTGDALLAGYLGPRITRRTLDNIVDLEVDGRPPDIVIIDMAFGDDTLEQIQTTLTSAVVVNVSGSLSDEMPRDGLIAEALAGVIQTMGYFDDDPMPYGFLFSEHFAGIRAAGAALSGLLSSRQEAGGVCQTVGIYESIFESMDSPVEEVMFGGWEPRRDGGQRPGLVIPYGFFSVRDGHVGIISAGSWSVLAELMGEPELGDDPRFATLEARLENKDLVIGRLRNWLSKVSTAQELEALAKNDLSVTQVRTLRELIDNDPLRLGETLEPSADGPYLIAR